MGRIKKLIEAELVGGTQGTEIYPITSTKAVYDANNKSLDSIISIIDSRIMSLQFSSDDSINSAIHFYLKDGVIATRAKIWRDSNNLYIQLFNDSTTIALIPLSGVSQFYSGGIIEVKLYLAQEIIGYLAINSRFDFSIVTTSKSLEGDITYTQYDSILDLIKYLQLYSALEINVSALYPTEGLESTNRYSLELAKEVLSKHSITNYMRVSFLDSVNNLRTYERNGNLFWEIIHQNEIFRKADNVRSSFFRKIVPSQGNIPLDRLYEVDTLRRTGDNVTLSIVGVYNGVRKTGFSKSYTIEGDIQEIRVPKFLSEETIEYFDITVNNKDLQEGDFTGVGNILSIEYLNTQYDLLSTSSLVHDLEDTILQSNLPPIAISQLPRNAVTGFVIEERNDTIKNIGIPTTAGTTGEFYAEYNEEAYKKMGVKNVVKTKLTSTVNNRNFLSIVVPKENLIKAGADFDTDNVYISVKYNIVNTSRQPAGWVCLRYGKPLDYLMSASSDVLINDNGSVGFLGTGDSMWDDISVEKTTIPFHGKAVNNIRVPSTYKGSPLTGIIIEMMSDGISTPGYHEQIFCSPAVIIGTSIDSTIDYPNIIDDDSKEDLSLPRDIYLADIGSSFVNANHTGVDDIEEGDPYMPFDGYAGVSTYKRKSHMYYIAKQNRLKWANYGWGGTTLVHCAAKAFPDKVYFPLVDERKEQLKEGIDWDYICITLGGNDIYYGPIYMRDLWLQEQYGRDIGYPVTPEQIGAEGFANQEQKEACDAVTGEVFGVQYEDNESYFFAKFIGEISSKDPNTWYGAWNIVLPYFMHKYKKSKIVIIDPLVAGYGDKAKKLKEAIANIANKWGVNFFDFNSLNWFYGKIPQNFTAFPNPDREDGKWELPNGTLLNGTVFGYITSRMSYDGQHPTNLGYQKIAGPIGNAIINQ